MTTKVLLPDPRLENRVKITKITADSFASPEATPQTRSQPDDVRPPAFTDEALALHFAERHADNLRHVAAYSKWLIWDGKRWLFDDTLLAFDLARKVCRETATNCRKRRVAEC